MAIYFSEKFKQLRKDKDLTQDQIAGIFHISPQAVSRWETGATYPDIEILPHLAIFFKVTVDELLGTEKIRGEEKAKEYIRDIRNLLNSGKIYDAIELARKA
ncbi:MAG: helix-turn-helix transcriptional regulator, partial [Eubacteriales bacterium]|nr:helix-turn-helix transcriptional regulator [Eubacteriales bacterium]